MKKKKLKSVYLRVRLPAIKASGSGAHQTAKGGKYRRGDEKTRIRREIKAELE